MVCRQHVLLPNANNITVHMLWSSPNLFNNSLYADAFKDVKYEAAAAQALDNRDGMLPARAFECILTSSEINEGFVTPKLS